MAVPSDREHGLLPTLWATLAGPLCLCLSVWPLLAFELSPLSQDLGTQP